VLKPQIGVQQFLHESALVLADAVRAAAVARVTKRGAPAPRRAAPARRPFPSGSEPSANVIAVGASTGGTTALRVLLQGMRADSPAMVIVQHMPRAFTGAFARALDAMGTVHVREAVDGDRLVRGVALLAPGDEHMRVVQAPRGGYAVEIVSGPLVSRHRPSVDVLFRSVAGTYGGNAIGILLTGMGADGAEGLLEMRRSGALTIAQDEATSVVFGMPREAMRRGAVERILPLHEIAAAIDLPGCSAAPAQSAE
jgi:two-component system, chemotaxis family, protein-glutamate methylesterase/glutaminase